MCDIVCLVCGASLHFGKEKTSVIKVIIERKKGMYLPHPFKSFISCQSWLIQEQILLNYWIAYSDFVHQNTKIQRLIISRSESITPILNKHQTKKNKRKVAQESTKVCISYTRDKGRTDKCLKTIDISWNSQHFRNLMLNDWLLLLKQPNRVNNEKGMERAFNILRP